MQSHLPREVYLGTAGAGIALTSVGASSGDGRRKFHWKTKDATTNKQKSSIIGLPLRSINIPKWLPGGPVGAVALELIKKEAAAPENFPTALFSKSAPRVPKSGRNGWMNNSSVVI
jgi:hypothetical protein